MRKRDFRLRYAFVIGSASAIALAIGVGPAVANGPAESPKPTPREAPVRVDLQPGAQPVPKIKAASWIIADANTGEILAAKDESKARPPASTLKTLTAFTLIPRLPGTTKYVGRKQDETTEGAHVGVVAGMTYTVNDLMYGMLLPSGNDAASALANANGGWGPTLEQMNAEARRLQANNTVAKTPSGLDEPGQLSSAKDLATIFRAGMQLPEFQQYLAVKSAQFPLPAKPGKKSPGPTTIYSENRLLLHDFQGIEGGKTGYTTNAGRTFVAQATRGNRALVIALMVITSPTETAANKLFNWGFANADRVTPIGSLPEPLTDAPATTAAAAVPATASELKGANATINTSANPLAAPSRIAAITLAGLMILALVIAVVIARRNRRRVD
ncbi:MAG: D-alanyl-D-alanine carboxypeptidase family protein [Candidatus Nanopelagicales bacterium]